MIDETAKKPTAKKPPAVALDAREEQDELTLRPKTLTEYVGQEQSKKGIATSITAARQRKDAFDHTLIYGPPGLGKTTLAQVIAHELDVPFAPTSGPAIERPGDLASLLTNLAPNAVLFIDEIHRLRPAVEEVLYGAMEDFKLDLVLGKGPAAQSIRLDLQPFTLIAATTKAGNISSPLRDRFGHILRLEYYTEEEIGRILRRSAKILGIEIDAPAVDLLAGRSRLTPRIANRLLKRLRDEAQVHHDGSVSAAVAESVLADLGIDALGLDRQDRAYLEALTGAFAARPTGLETLAAALSEDAQTIEDVVEPYLLRHGMIERTPRGRVATAKAYGHMGKTALGGAQGML